MCDLHYLSHIVFRVWERKRDRGQPGKSGTADSRHSSATKHSKSGNGGLAPAAPLTRGQGCQNPEAPSSPYRLEISFSTGAKDGFGRDFFLIERDAHQHQVLNSGAGSPGLRGEYGGRTDLRAVPSCAGYGSGSVPGVTQSRAGLRQLCFRPSFMKRGLHAEEDDDFVGLHSEQACRGCACPRETRLPLVAVTENVDESTKPCEKRKSRPIPPGCCRHAVSCGWSYPTEAPGGPPVGGESSDASRPTEGGEQWQPPGRSEMSPPASRAFEFSSRPSWTAAQEAGPSFCSAVAHSECAPTRGVGGAEGTRASHDAKAEGLCWEQAPAPPSVHGRCGAEAAAGAADVPEDSSGGNYKGAGVLVAPYCQLAPLVSLAHSSDLERFEVLMNKVGEYVSAESSFENGWEELLLLQKGGGRIA